MTARGGWSLLASVEKQVCFDNAFLEVLVGPRTERESGLTHAGLVALCDRLRAEGTVSAFATCPVTDTGLVAAYLACGFRRTGTLPDHLLVGDERVDAFLLTRKLSSPGAEPFPE
ncbi:MAG: hypothetical protein FJ104_16360 [Deltaproteobacteria bacterium]|nr:hypothetical protein [Deltaproteobacteria bacterium]